MCRRVLVPQCVCDIAQEMVDIVRNVVAFGLSQQTDCTIAKDGGVVGWRPRIGTDTLDDSLAHVDLEQNVDSGNMRRRRAPALAFHKSQTVRSFWDGIGPPRNPLTDSPPASPLQEDHTMQTTGGAPTSAASAGTSNAARQWQSTQHLHQWLFLLLF